MLVVWLLYLDNEEKNILGKGPLLTLSKLWNPVNTQNTGYLLYLQPLNCHQSARLLRRYISCQLVHIIHRLDGIPQFFFKVQANGRRHFKIAHSMGQRLHKGMQKLFRCPTLYIKCGWDIFHPPNSSVMLLWSLENATATFLWQSKHYLNKEFAQRLLRGGFCMEINLQVNTVCVTLFSQTPQTLCIYYSINMKASHFRSHFFP